MHKGASSARQRSGGSLGVTVGAVLGNNTSAHIVTTPQRLIVHLAGREVILVKRR